jgi:ABC-type sugar transport system permease subunit
MLMNLYDKALVYFAANPALNAIAHFAAGFGLALLLQHYLKGNAFLPTWLGWVLVIFSAVVHFLAIK